MSAHLQPDQHARLGIFEYQVEQSPVRFEEHLWSDLVVPESKRPSYRHSRSSPRSTK
jgi:hypothetical protein